MIKNIEVKLLRPHPHNPRKDLGDLTELSESIKISGILQNLTVVPAEEGYTVIIGHRRLAAAILAGLEEVPCAVVEMDEKTQIATMLLENIQRNDLTLYEQAQGIQMMLDLGETIGNISEKTGFSESTVRRRVNLAKLDQDTLLETMSRNVTLNDYARLDQIKDIDRRNEVLACIGTSNFEWKLSSAIEEEQRPVRKAELIEELKEFATEVEDLDYEKYSTAEYFYEFRKPRSYQKPEHADPDEYVFRVDSHSIYLYEKAVEEEEEINPERNRFDEISTKLKTLSQRAYELRYKFVKSFTNFKQYEKEIRYEQMYRLLSRDLVSINQLIEILEIEYTEDENFTYVEDRRAKKKLILKEYETHQDRLIFLGLYANYGDQEDNDYVFAKSWGGLEIKHKENGSLNKLYDFLISIGYEMSDEEQQLRDGTHELFAEFSGEE